MGLFLVQKKQIKIGGIQMIISDNKAIIYNSKGIIAYLVVNILN